MTEPHVVRAEPDTQLAQLLALYPGVKEEFDAAKERLDAIKAALKATAVETDPTATKFLLSGTDGQVLTVQYKVVRTLDTKGLNRDHPHVYDAYTRESGRWELRG